MRCFILSIFCLTLTGCGLDESTNRVDKPVSREVASRDISLPFPPSTRDVYYFVHTGGMQEFQMYVRFTVDPKDLDSTVNQLHSGLSDPTTNLAVAPHSPDSSQFQHMTWWNPDSITNGYYRGDTNGRSFYVWADVGAHTIYLCTTD